MAIVAYVGLPGHGKSYSVVEHVILPALKAGRCVVTNLALHFDVVRAEFPGCDLRDFDAEAVLKNPPLIEQAAPGGCVLVIDECWKLWPAGMSAKNVPGPFQSILAEHRHRVDEAGRSMQVVLVTQDLMQIATFARQLVEETYRTVKLTSLGMSKSYRVDVYQGAVSGSNPPERRRINQLAGKYKPLVFKFYKSHTKSASSESGADETKVDGRGVIWRSPALIAGAVIGGLFLVAGFWSVWRFFHPDEGAERYKVGAGQVASTAAPGTRAPVPVRTPTSRWWIVGEIRGLAGGDVVLLEDGARSVTLAIRDWCDRDVSGFLVCAWDGQEISSQVRRLRLGSAPASSGQSSILPWAAAPAAE